MLVERRIQLGRDVAKFAVAHGKNRERREVMPSMRLDPIAFARAHPCAAATHFRARVDATSMAEAELLSTPGARPTIVARSCAIGVNAESAK